VNILQIVKDPKLFGSWFKGDSWQAWKAFLAACFALPATAEQREIFKSCTGRTEWPTAQAKETWLCVGRRGGKSILAALVAVFLACFRGYAGILGPGEVATVMVIAADRRQARVVLRFVTGFLEGVPMLKAMITRRTQETIELSNRVVLEVHTCSFRTTRGYTLAAVVCDEIAFWRNEDSASPDIEILNGLRPGMSTIPGALLLCISSPYARRGALWEAFRKHYGKDSDPVLVWQAPTRTMNPSVDQSIIDAALEADEASARAEYLAEFRSDLEVFIPVEVLRACVIPGRIALPPVAGNRYVGFVDPAGGSGSDSMTLGIAHRTESDRLILDCLLERKPPFNPAEVAAEFSATLLSYRCREIQGDRFAGEWCRQPFGNRGIRYEPASKNKSEIYLDTLPLLNSARVELLDNPRLIHQLASLERRVSKSGRDSVDHGPRGHDDCANSACGALILASSGRRPHDFGITV
jgi:hypothetical protein